MAQQHALVALADRGVERLLAAYAVEKAGAWGDFEDYHAINVLGTENVIAACRAHGIRYLVHTSSPSVVHSGGDIMGGDESIPIASHFSAPYPETKAEAEKRVIAANDDSLKTCALRPHLIWGPGDPHILPRLAEKARGGSIALPAPDKIIDTIFVENAASIGLHKACGFREVGHRERIGQMHGVWRDVMLLERRSEIVGT